MGNIRDKQENGGVVLNKKQKELLEKIDKQSIQNQTDFKFKEKDEEEKRIQKILEQNRKESIEAQVAIAVKQATKAIKQIQKETGKELTSEQKTYVKKYLLSGEKRNLQQVIVDKEIKEEKEKQLKGREVD